MNAAKHERRQAIFKLRASQVVHKPLAPGAKQGLNLFMRPRHLIHILPLALLCIFLSGCAHGEHQDLGTIDLSKKSAKASFTFEWNTHYPSLALVFSDTNGVSGPISTNPQWPLEIKVDVLDKASGKPVVSKNVTQKDMLFANWYAPKTCLSLDISGFHNFLVAGSSYNFVLTVVQEKPELGLAKVTMEWVVGGDSM